MNLAIKLLGSLAKIPTRADSGSAGYDLYSIEHASISSGSRTLIGTAISIAVPDGFYARIAPRSGLAVKHGIDVLAGVVDASYRGEVKVVLVNLGQSDFVVKPGDRIAQLIIEKCHDVEWKEVNELPPSSRGADGFGSSGK